MQECTHSYKTCLRDINHSNCDPATVCSACGNINLIQSRPACTACTDCFWLKWVLTSWMKPSKLWTYSQLDYCRCTTLHALIVEHRIIISPEERSEVVVWASAVRMLYMWAYTISCACTCVCVHACASCVFGICASHLSICICDSVHLCVRSVYYKLKDLVMKSYSISVLTRIWQPKGTLNLIRDIGFTNNQLGPQADEWIQQLSKRYIWLL